MEQKQKATSPDSNQLSQPYTKSPEKAISYLSQKRYWVFAICIIAIIGAGFGLFRYGSHFPETNYLMEELAKEPDYTPLEGWKEYHHDVLGVSFYYPPEWKTLDTTNIDHITKLDLLNQNSSINDDSKNKIYVGFGEQNITVSLLSKNYLGERHRYNYREKEYIDNLGAVRASKDICTYQKHFEEAYVSNTIKEIFNECRNGVKIALTEEVHSYLASDNERVIKYGYTLQYYGYKQLQNKEFNDFFTTYRASNAAILDTRLTAQEYFNKFNVDLESDPNLKLFTEFITSIRSYKPHRTAPKPFQADSNEDPKVTVLRQYYYLLLTGELNRAYQMLDDPDQPLLDFITTHQNLVHNAEAYDFKKQADSEYAFWAKYQLHNQAPEFHRVIAEVRDGKIEFLQKDVSYDPPVTHEGYLVYGATRNSTNILVLEENGKSKIIDSSPHSKDDEIDYENFWNISFSPTGRYIKYQVSGWEWGETRIFDLKSRKMVLTISGDGEFNPSDNLFFACDSNEFSGDFEAKVFDMNSLTVKLDLLQSFQSLQQYPEISCHTDTNNSVAIFEFGGMWGEVGIEPEDPILYKLNLNSGELIH